MIDTEQTSSRAIALVAKFILVPVLLIYTAIIYFYAAKIAIDGVMPSGQIGWMVLLYGAAGTITLLCVYPTRHTGGALVSLFYRHWPSLTLLPVALLFIAVYARTDQYGVTDRRYLVILAGIWLVLQALLFGLRSEDKRDLRTIVASFAALIAVAMAGPWGAIGSTTRLLAADFNTIAASSPAFKNGAFDKASLQGTEQRRLISIVKYLGDNGRLDLLLPTLAANVTLKDVDTAPAATISARQTQAAKVAEAIGLPGYFIDPSTVDGRQYFTFYAGKAILFNGSERVAGPFVLSHSAGTSDNMALTLGEGATARVSAELNRRGLEITLGNGRSVSFEAASLGKAMKDGRQGSYESTPPLRFASGEGAAAVELIVTAGAGSEGASGIELSTVTFWLLWRD